MYGARYMRMLICAISKYPLLRRRINGNAFLRYAPNGNWYGEAGATYRSSIFAHEANKPSDSR
jgi:hypothetical protein